MKDSHPRSFLKGVSWRILGTIDTIVLSYIVTGALNTSLKIGFTEVATKIVLYYFHERLWNVIPFGRIDGVGPTHARSFTKGVTWRMVGTMDTMVVAYFITGHPLNAVTIGSFEVFTKIALFYVHERIWGAMKWGRMFDNPTQETEVPTEELPVQVVSSADPAEEDAVLVEAEKEEVTFEK